MQLAPGIALAGALALVAMQLATLPWLLANGISALTLAIVLGMIVGNTVYPRIAERGAPGVTFSKQILLRAGIILFGLRLTFQDIADVGLAGVVIDALVLSSTFALSWWAGTRLFGLDRKTALLIGAGSSICGAAAVMAAEPVVRGRAAQVTVAVSTVVVFGTVSIFLYPALYHLNEHYQLLTMSPTGFGIYAGSTIHEVAQVLAAGRAVSEDVANTAVITKMVRVMMLAPFLIILSAYLSRNPDARCAAGLARRREIAARRQKISARRHSLVCLGFHRGGGIQFIGASAAAAHRAGDQRRHLYLGDGDGGLGRHHACVGGAYRRRQTAGARRNAIRLADLWRCGHQRRRCRHHPVVGLGRPILADSKMLDQRLDGRPRNLSCV